LSGDSGVTVLASLLHKHPNLADTAIAGIARSHAEQVTHNGHVIFGLDLQ